MKISNGTLIFLATCLYWLFTNTNVGKEQLNLQHEVNRSNHAGIVFIGMALSSTMYLFELAINLQAISERNDRKD